MASINNLMVKNVNYFMTKNGEMCQGDVYLKGKKIGFWSQDGNGGEDNYDFDLGLLTKLAEKYKKKLPHNFVLKEYFDEFMLLHEVVQFNDFEELYKKNISKGYPTTICVTNGLEYQSIGTKDEQNASTIKIIDEIKEKLSHSYMGDCDVIVYTFKSPFDFTISI